MSGKFGQLLVAQGIERLALERYGEPRSARQVIEAVRSGDDPAARQVMIPYPIWFK